MEWTAPEAGTDEINFFAAFNAANGNGNTSGDQIYTSLLTVPEIILMPQVTAVMPDNGQQGWQGDVTISGLDTDWENGVNDIIFKLHSNTSVTFEPDDFTVDNNLQITASLMINGDQESGSYDVHVDDLVLENGFMVVGQPALLTVTPNWGLQGDDLQVTISGEYTNWTSVGVNDVTFKLHANNDITFSASQIAVTSDSEVVADISIGADQLDGPYDLFLDDLVLENAF